MKIPNPHRAFLGEKLETYTLDQNHLVGKHKAILFKNRLGITLQNKEILEKALLKSVAENDAKLKNETEFGTNYEIIFEMRTPVGASFVKSHWIVRHGEDFPRLVGTFPINFKRANKK